MVPHGTEGLSMVSTQHDHVLGPKSDLYFEEWRQ